jgi:hypothetical protein
MDSASRMLDVEKVLSPATEFNGLRRVGLDRAIPITFFFLCVVGVKWWS